jgi:4-aminobutyrate aminotransferase-like enzyme
VAEPVLGRGGYLPAPLEYFRRLKEILDEHNILFVADEVQMGFFRAGRLWSIENYDVVPDIIVFGKAVTNGMFPLSGLWAREPLMAPQYWPVGSSHATFAAAPLGTALGLATLQLCASQDWAARAEEIGRTVEVICKRLAEQYQQIRYINRIGAALSLDIADTSGEPAPSLAHAIVEIALQGDIDIEGKSMGLVMTAGGSYGNMIMLAPSLSMKSSSLDLLERLLQAVFARAVMSGGAFEVIDAG